MSHKSQWNSPQAIPLTIEPWYGNLLLDKITEEKRKIWEEVITSANVIHNSRKAWKTINKLSNDPTSSNPPCLVTANQVAHQLLVNRRGTMPSKPKRPVLPPATEGDTSKVYPFSEGEYNKGVAALKNNKAAGRDDIMVEQLMHLGPKAHKWLLTLLNICFMENKIPTIWRQSKIIAILKPGKDSFDSKELPTYIPLISHVQTLQKNDTEQDSTCHRTTPNQGTGRFQIREIMHKSTPKPHTAY